MLKCFPPSFPTRLAFPAPPSQHIALMCPFLPHLSHSLSLWKQSPAPCLVLPQRVQFNEAGGLLGGMHFASCSSSFSPLPLLPCTLSLSLSQKGIYDPDRFSLMTLLAPHILDDEEGEAPPETQQLGVAGGQAGDRGLREGVTGNSDRGGDMVEGGDVAVAGERASQGLQGSLSGSEGEGT